jgi:hypothetical protein
MQWLHKRVITDGTREPYLVRYIVVATRWFRIYAHHILRSDIDRELHDHPGDFISFVLRGGYWEHSRSSVKWYGPGSVIYRRAEYAHRLELKPGTTAWTFVLFGRTRRRWGFHTSKGWADSKAYYLAGNK